MVVSVHPHLCWKPPEGQSIRATVGCLLSCMLPVLAGLPPGKFRSSSNPRSGGGPVVSHYGDSPRRRVSAERSCLAASCSWSLANSLNMALVRGDSLNRRLFSWYLSASSRSWSPPSVGERVVIPRLLRIAMVMPRSMSSLVTRWIRSRTARLGHSASVPGGDAANAAPILWSPIFGREPRNDQTQPYPGTTYSDDSEQWDGGGTGKLLKRSFL